MSQITLLLLPFHPMFLSPLLLICCRILHSVHPSHFDHPEPQGWTSRLFPTPYRPKQCCHEYHRISPYGFMSDF